MWSRAESVDRKPPIEKTVPEFCLILFQIALQLVSRSPQEKAENNISLVSGANFDEEYLRRLVKEVDDCKWLLESSGDEGLAAKGFAKK